MGFLKDYKYDIFVSYSHVDNLTAEHGDKGWVDRFHDELQLKLWQRFGEMKSVSLWWDTRKIDPSQDFQRTIRAGLEETGIFLALTSRGYIRDNSYTRKELSWFFQNASTDTVGLTVGDRRRIFNLLLYNLKDAEWPREYRGGGKFVFFEADHEEDFGFPAQHQSSLFTQEIKRLVDAIEKTLRALKRIEVTRDNEGVNRVAERRGARVFLAETSDVLRLTRRRVEEELKRHGVEVVESIPPPFFSAEHARQVADEIEKSTLSIHLLDNLPGSPIPDELDKKTYPHKQVELGVEHAHSQIIWLPKKSDMLLVEDESYRNFLDLLERKKREDEAKYEFIREQQTANVIAPTILEKLKRLTPQESTHTPAVLIDAHVKDKQYALKLGQYFKDRDIEAYINAEEEDPGKNIDLIEERMKKSRALVIVYGEVAERLVQNRVAEAMKAVISARARLDSFNIFLAPPRKSVTESEFSYGIFSFRVLDNSDSETLKTSLLDPLVEMLKKGDEREVKSLAS